MALSQAHLKIGPSSSEGVENYDFMIDLKEGESIKEMMAHTLYYLFEINKKVS